MRLRSIALACLVAPSLLGATRETTDIIRKVALTGSSFNPSSAQSISISASFTNAGNAQVAVLDRDGVRVRTLPKQAVKPATAASWSWDGRDEAGVVVPDEAYSFRIDWSDGKKTALYLPAARHASMQMISPKYYDRRGSTLAYELPGPCRVHIQAGTAVEKGSERDVHGPAMKTIANREPRSGGSIAEHWDGFDESNTIYVPDLKDFVIAIAAWPLPENSVITYGNRQQRFIDAVASRRGTSELPSMEGTHAHHAGLSTLDDVSPALALKPSGATWSPREGGWILKGDALRLEFTPTGPSAAPFARHRGTIRTYVNSDEVAHAAASPRASTSTVARSRLKPGVNVVTVNWESAFGPVAANSLRLIVPPETGRSTTESQ